jgi:hypothetical protein
VCNIYNPNDEFVEIRLTRKELNKAIIGGLRSTINDHRILDRNLFGSASKRIMGQIIGLSKEKSKWF